MILNAVMFDVSHSDTALILPRFVRHNRGPAKVLQLKSARQASSLMDMGFRNYTVCAKYMLEQCEYSGTWDIASSMSLENRKRKFSERRLEAA